MPARDKTTLNLSWAIALTAMAVALAAVLRALVVAGAV
jgi:hypothetical protein